jgi:transcriptional regulator with XRE-family HTH domain
MADDISPSQLRAARALINLKRSDLAKRSKVGEQTIHRFENNLVKPSSTTRRKLRTILELADIEFTANEGVRLKPSCLEVYEGAARFDEFYDFIYEHLKQSGGNICIYGNNARLFTKYRKDPEIHRNRMRDLLKERPDFSTRILQEEGDDYMPTTAFAKYRWQKKEYFPPTAYYVFGSCVALISFEGARPPFVILIKSALFAEAYLRSFNLAWRMADIPSSLKPQPPKAKKRP